MLSVLRQHSAPASAQRGPSPGPRALVRQCRARRVPGWTLRRLTKALGLTRVNRHARRTGVTFDDAYADFLGALDLLSQHDARPTLYIPTSQPDESSGLARSDDRSHSWTGRHLLRLAQPAVAWSALPSRRAARWRLAASVGHPKTMAHWPMRPDLHNLQILAAASPKSEVHYWSNLASLVSRREAL